MGDPETWVQEALASGKRIMGFGHRIYRAEDPRLRILKRTAKELGSEHVEVAEELEHVALAALQERHPERVLATNVEYYSAIVLDVAEIPPKLAPAMFACSVSPVVRAHPRAEADRSAVPAVGALRRASVPVAADRVTPAEAAEQANALAAAGDERARPRSARNGTTSSRRRRATRTIAVRGVAYRAIAQFRFRPEARAARRGLEDERRRAARRCSPCGLSRPTIPAT